MGNSCVISGKDSLRSTQCNYHYIPLIFHKILPRGESTRCGVKRERGGEVIPGRKGVGGSLRPGQSIPDASPPPPTEAAHQGAAVGPTRSPPGSDSGEPGLGRSGGTNCYPW